MTIRTVTYFAPLAAEQERWAVTAFMPNGDKAHIIAFGPTEEFARNKIVGLIERELARYSKTVPSEEISRPVTGRGAHFIGKTWVIHNVTREKRRVDTAEATKLIESGEWAKGGPRSK